MSAIQVSFCLPCYNVQPYVADCVDSILSQGLPEDSYEILCVDDRSTDETWKELQTIRARHPGVRLLQNPENHGVSYSRNVLIRESQGKYIWFVDPDDLLCPNAAKRFLKAAERSEADVLVGNYYRVREADTVAAYSPEPPTDLNPRPMGEALPHDQNGVLMNAIWAGVIRRDFLISNALSFNEKMITQEDTLLYFEMSVKAKRFLKTDAVAYLYRQRGSSVMNTHSEARNRKTYFTIRELLRAYMEHLSTGDYRDRKELDEKIWQSRQSVTACLAALSDKVFVRSELKCLREEGVYPYRMRRRAMEGQDNPLVKLLRFLLPIRPCFWLYHAVYQVYNRRRNNQDCR